MSTPQTLAEWEHALTNRFLRVQGDGDRLPIRSFEITAETLAQACSQDGIITASAASEAFTTACRQRRDTARALKDGTVNLHVAGTSGFFTFLALTIYIDNALYDDAEGSGAFRAKLAEVLGQSFSTLKGVEEMWISLRGWLEAKSARDDSYRTLILPERPDKWNNIGLTKRLSFPSKRDLREGRAILQGNFIALEDVRLLIRAFEPFYANHHSSAGFKDAFANFQNAWLDGNRHLANHPFWSFARRCAENNLAEGDTADRFIEASLDEDEAYVFTARSEDPEIESETKTLDRLVQAYGNGLTLKLARKGVLAFRQSGYGRWTSVPGLDECRSPVLIACHRDHKLRLTPFSECLIASGSWLVTRDAIAVADAVDILKKFEINGSHGYRILDINVSDGIRTGPNWLGRSAFLPKVSYDASLLVGTALKHNGKAEIAFAPAGDGDGRIRCEAPLDGFVQIDAMAAPQATTPFWSRQIAFAKNALPHAELGGSAQSFDKLQDLEQEVSAGPPQIVDELRWEGHDRSIADLAEAVYAGGRVGWATTDLVTLISRAFPEQPNPWSVIALLQSAGMIEARLRPQWKGVIWVLRPPALVHWESRLDAVVLVDGGICAQQAEDFKRAAEAIGAKPFRRQGIGQYSPPVYGCQGGDLHAIAHRLGWPLKQGLARTTLRASYAATETRPLPSYQTAVLRNRNWEPYRQDGPAPIGTILRHRHPTDAAHDVFEVARERSPFFTLSSTAAFATAATASRQPCFRSDEGYLIGLRRGARLPYEIATALRHRGLRNGGLIEGHHCYPLAQSDRSWLTKVLGELVDFSDRADDAEKHAASSRLRHRPGARVYWVDGATTTSLGAPMGGRS